MATLLAYIQFVYTGAAQTYTIPEGVTKVRVDLWGAQGQAGNANPAAPGQGGYVTGWLNVTAGEVLQINVGRQGQSGATAFGGGGIGAPSFVGGGGGGGATDIRQGGTGLSQRKAVAGGGGGAGQKSGTSTASGAGGAGGNQAGQPGTNGTSPAGAGGGGTQTAGGQGGTGDAGNGSAGSLGQGGSVSAGTAGGGGGGYYGGGAGGSKLGGNAVSAGGGGGSSYSGGLTGDITMQQGVRSGDGYATIAIYNEPPYAPTLTYPIGSATVDRAQPIPLQWIHRDAPNDTQTAFSVRWRPVGTTSWTQQVVSSTASTYNIAANSLTAGTWEWQAQTTDVFGETGPWSSSEFFQAASIPATPTITSPALDTAVGTASVNLTWTAVPHQAHEVRSVANNAGAPNTASVLYSSGVIAGTGTSRTVPLPVNGRTEHLQVRVRTNGLWSPWASRRITVSYTPPATPQVRLYPDSDQAAIFIDIVNPALSGSAPAVTSHELYRRETAKPTTTVLRMATAVSPGTDFVDYTPASRTDYEYQAVSYGANGTQSASDWTSDPYVPPTIPAGSTFPGFTSGL